MDEARAQHGDDGCGHSQQSRRLLLAKLQRVDLTLLVSVPLMLEYKAVMTRLKHLNAGRIDGSGGRQFVGCSRGSSGAGEIGVPVTTVIAGYQ
jgi:hypothetical protein